MARDGQSPVAVWLDHDPGEIRYLGVRPFDVGVAHKSRSHAIDSIYVTREGWMAFLREVAEDRAHENGVLEAVRSSGRVRQLSGGEQIQMPWCLRTIEHNQAVYLTDAEWDQFRSLARAGEFDVPPTPEMRPAIGRIGRVVCAVLLGLAVAALGAGVAMELLLGSGRWALLGTTGALACVAAVAYYRISRSSWSRTLTEARSETDGPSNDRLDRLVIRAPEYLVAIGVGAPLVAGAVVAVLTGDWRWAETGLTVATVLPAVVLIVTMLVFEATTGELSFGHLLVGGLLVVGGLPAVLLGWLWTADINVLLIGGPITIALVLASAWSAATAYLRGN